MGSAFLNLSSLGVDLLIVVYSRGVNRRYCILPLKTPKTFMLSIKNWFCVILMPPPSALMVNVKRGVLIECDPALRQLLSHLDVSSALGPKFIVKELDETHIFVDKDIIPELEQKLEQVMESLSPDYIEK